jgi:hypothetical protein
MKILTRKYINDYIRDVVSLSERGRAGEIKDKSLALSIAEDSAEIGNRAKKIMHKANDLFLQYLEVPEGERSENLFAALSTISKGMALGYTTRDKDAIETLKIALQIRNVDPEVNLVHVCGFLTGILVGMTMPNILTEE